MQQTSAWCDQVFAQLERILESEQFKKSNRLGRFLTYVVEQTLSNSPKTIRSYNIAIEVFGKGPDFDPGDPYVRNIARLTRRALRNFYDNASEADKVIVIDVPAGNYIATFTLVKEDPRVTANEGSQPVTAQIAESISEQYHNNSPIRERTDAFGPTIAVIPFKYQGAVADKEVVIGEILASGLISGLSKSPRLHVISWLSTTQFRQSQCDVLGVSQRLNCDYMVSGSYTCRGDHLSIYIEIADCMSLEVVWAEQRISTVEKLVSVDAEIIAELILDVAKVVLDQEVYRALNEPLESLQLHTKLIGGMWGMHSDSDRQFKLVRTHFEQILEHNPGHATVNALLAQWYVLKINRGGGWNGGDNNRSQLASEVHLQSALKRNPTHPLALTMQGLVETQFNKNPEKGLKLYNVSEKYNPNDPVLMSYKAAALSYKGQAKEAIRYAEKAFTLSPCDPQTSLFHTCAAAAYYADGDCEKAKNHADSAYEINPAHTSNLRTLVAIQVDLGDVARARRSALELLSIDPGFTTGSYLRRSPNASYSTGKKIAERLERAGIPAG